VTADDKIPAVRITLTDIYNELIEVKTRLGDHPKQLDDHERRIRNLEMKVWSASGLAGIVAIVITQLLRGV
jgi:hypothetical protein